MDNFLKSMYKTILYLLLLFCVRISRWSLPNSKKNSDFSTLKTPSPSPKMTSDTIKTDCSDCKTPPKCNVEMTSETKTNDCSDLKTPSKCNVKTPETKQNKDWADVRTPPNTSFRLTPVMRSHRPGSSSRIITSMKRLSQRKATPYPYHISKVLFDTENFTCSTPKRTNAISRIIFQDSDGFDNCHFTPIKM